MTWYLIVVGVLFVLLAIDIAQLRIDRTHLSRPMEDSELFGHARVTEQHRNILRLRFSYGPGAAKILVALFGASGLGLVALGVGLI